LGGSAGIEHSLAECVDAPSEIQQLANAGVNLGREMQGSAVDSGEVAAFRPGVHASMDLVNRREGALDGGLGYGRGGGCLNGNQRTE